MNQRLLKTLLFTLLIFSNQKIISQIGIGTTSPDPSSVMEMESTNAGLLIPRINLSSTTDTVTIPSPAISLLIYNTNATLGEGFYYWNGTSWTSLKGASKIDNLMDGASDQLYNVSLGENAGTLFIPDPSVFAASGKYNVAVGIDALATSDAGGKNVAIGYKSMESATTATHNVGVGNTTLQSTLGGSDNTAIGNDVLQKNVNGNNNTVLGAFAMKYNISGSYNVAIGSGTIENLTSGDYNIAIGRLAANNQSGGNNNITIGSLIIDPVNLSGSNQLNIGNIIYGVDMDGTGATVSSGNIGIKEKAPSSAMDINGSLATAILYQSIPVNTQFDLTNNHHTLIADYDSTTGTDVSTVRFPAASSCPGRIYVIKLYVSNFQPIGAGGLQITSLGGTIDGNASQLVQTNKETLTFQSDGSNWWIISKF
jgi:trimeric autotransporter adhesin